MRPRAVLPGLLFTTLIVAGCGGGSTSGTTTSDPTAPAPSVSTAATVRTFADCSAIPAADMAPALGKGVATATVPPASTSCTYALEDPRLPSVNIEQFAVSDFADGWAGAKAKIATTVAGAIEGTPATVPGIGDDAEVVSGPSDSPVVPDAIGLVKLGDTIVRASVLDASGLTPAQVAAVTTKVLQVVADHA
jgi:hypothetical protein